jgi:threonine/homoserine/homoserine lactone efflux protein
MDALVSPPAVSLHSELGLAGVALGLVLTPGPNMIYLVSRSITQGRRAALISLAGVGTAFLVYVAAVTAGIATVFTLVPLLYTGIKLAGAAYLLWLAWTAVRPGGSAVFAPRELPADPPCRLYAMGLLTCLLNPKLAILYLSLLPQFVDPSRGHVAEQTLLLGLTQIVIAITVNGLIALAAGAIAGFFVRRPAWLRVQRYVMGSVLAGLALHIAADRAGATVA